MKLSVTPDTVLSVAAMRSNILDMIHRDMAEAERQRAWYRRTNRRAKLMSHVLGYSPMIVASAIAVLSPSVDWQDNVRLAHAILSNPDTDTFRNRLGNTVRLVGYGKNIAKARNIVRHNDPSYLRGPKVVPFRDAILGVRDYAVVDVHATNAAMGTFNKYDGPGKALHTIALAYEAAAKALGWGIVETQAAAWVNYKAIKPKRGEYLQERLGL